MRSHPITQDEFDKIKQLVKKGVSYTMIGDLLGRNSTTVSRVARSSNLNEYLEARKLANENFKAKKTESEDREVISNDSQVVELLTEQNRKLYEITGYLRDCARLLNQISEQWK